MNFTNYYSKFFTTTSQLSVNQYNLLFLDSGVMHSTNSCSFNSDNKMIGIISKSFAICVSILVSR